MKKLMIGVGLVVVATAVGMTACDVAAAELTSEQRGFNWQDREYFGDAYKYRTLGGGDSAAAGESGDAGAAAGGSTGGDGGNSGDGGCGPQ